jgi:hypothetical protein
VAVSIKFQSTNGGDGEGLESVAGFKQPEEISGLRIFYYYLLKGVRDGAVG